MLILIQIEKDCYIISQIFIYIELYDAVHNTTFKSYLKYYLSI